MTIFYSHMNLLFIYLKLSPMIYMLATMKVCANKQTPKNTNQEIIQKMR